MVDFAAQVKITAKDETTRVIEKVNKSVSKLTSTTKGLRTSLIESGRQFRNFGIGIAKVGAAAAAAGGAVFAFVKKTGDSVDRLSKQATRLGLTTNQLQQYRFAANLAGLENAQFEQSIVRLNRSIGDSFKGGELATVFDALGISEQDRLGDTIDVFKQLADVSQSLINSGERAFVTSALQSIFGRSGSDLITLFEGGSAAINDAAAEFAKIGRFISDNEEKSFVGFIDNSLRLTTALKGLGLEVASGLVGPIDDATKSMTAFIAANRQLISQRIQDTIESIAVSAKIARNALSALAQPFMPIIESIGKANILAGIMIGLFSFLAFKVIKLAIAPFFALGKAVFFLGKALIFLSKASLLLIASNPILLKIAAAGFVLAAVATAIYKNWSFLKDNFPTIVSTILAPLRVLETVLRGINKLYDRAVSGRNIFTGNPTAGSIAPNNEDVGSGSPVIFDQQNVKIQLDFNENGIPFLKQVDSTPGVDFSTNLNTGRVSTS